jgi:drug/metabolite transporter (DMT)-like permease
VILGVVVALVATLAINTGFVLEKGALAALPPLNARLPLNLARMLVTTPRWLAGFSLIMVGVACQLVALTRIPLTVAQPVFSSGLVFLLLLAAKVLGERLTSHERTGLAGITAGIICIVSSLDSRTDTAGTGGHVLRVLLVAAPSTLAGLAIFAAASRAGRRRPAADASYALAAGIVYGVAGMVTKGLSASIDFHGPLAIARSALVSPYLYLLAPVTLSGFLIFQTALQRGRASIVAPVSSVVSTLYTVAAGTPMFGEHLPSDPARLALRLTGLALIIFSLLWLPGRGRADEALALEGLPASSREQPDHLPS